jgi:hypothetical protein
MLLNGLGFFSRPLKLYEDRVPLRADEEAVRVPSLNKLHLWSEELLPLSPLYDFVFNIYFKSHGVSPGAEQPFLRYIPEAF